MAGADSISAAIRGPIFSESPGAQAVDAVNLWREKSRFERTPTDKGLNMKLHRGSTGVCTRLDGAEAAGCLLCSTIDGYTYMYIYYILATSLETERTSQRDMNLQYIISVLDALKSRSFADDCWTNLWNSCS